MNIEMNMPSLESKVSRHHEKREGLYEKFEKKIDLINELRDFVVESSQLSVDEMRSAFDERMQKMIDDTELDFVTSENQDKASEYRELEAQREEVLLSDEADEFDRLTLKMKEHQRDSDLVFNVKLQVFFENLLEKREVQLFVQELHSKQSDDFEHALLENEGVADADEAEVRVRFDSPYAVVSEVDDEHWESGQEGSLDEYSGGDFGDRKVSVVWLRSGGKEKEKILNHEINHVISRAFLGDLPERFHEDSFFEAMREAVRSLGDIDDSGNRELIKRMVMMEIGDFIEDYFEQAHHELVADVDLLERGELNSFLKVYLGIGERLDELVWILGDGELNRWAQERLSKMFEKFEKFVEKLGDLVFVASEAGEMDRLKGAVIAMNPGKIEVVEKFFKHKLGGKYEAYRSFKPLLKEGYDFEQYELLEDDLQYDQSDQESGGLLMDMLRRLRSRNTVEHFLFKDVFRFYDHVFVEEADVVLNDEEKEKIKSALLDVEVDEKLMGHENFSKACVKLSGILNYLEMGDVEKRLSWLQGGIREKKLGNELEGAF